MATVVKPFQFPGFFGPASRRARRLVRNGSSLAFFILLLCACESKHRGVLYDFDGNVVPGNLVRLIEVDDQGVETNEVGTRTSDAAGKFVFDGFPEANASLLVEASLPEGTLRGFLAGRNRDIPVHPLTSALVSLIQDITRSPEGRDFTDFTADELRGIGDAVFELDTDSLDLSDAEAVRDFLRDSPAARLIALAAGGAIDAVPTSTIENETTDDITFATDLSICGDGSTIYLLESGDFRFDVMENGALCGGSSADLSDIFYSGAFELKFPGEVFFTYGGDSFPFAALGTYTLEGDREIRLGPYSLRRPGTGTIDVPAEEDDLSVTRKIYVPVTGDYARFLTVLTNTGIEDRQLDLELRNFLRTDNESALLTFDSTEAIPGLSDRFLAVYDTSQDRPTAGFVFQDGLGSASLTTLNYPGKAGGQVNEVTFAWSDLTVPAGTTKTIVVYGLLTASRSAEDLHSTLSDLVVNPDMTGMNLVELEGLLNFTPGHGTILGEAGSVIGEATVTGTNERTSEGVTVTARSDGSFALPLDAESGDDVRITATDSLDTIVPVP